MANLIKTVTVIGGGLMGSGIAQASVLFCIITDMYELLLGFSCNESSNDT